MDPTQDERFREAVERKKAEAKERSEQRPPEASPGAPDAAEEVQASRVEAGRPQDTFSIRDKNAGKGKKTADKWNQ